MSETVGRWTHEHTVHSYSDEHGELKKTEPTDQTQKCTVELILSIFIMLHLIKCNTFISAKRHYSYNWHCVSRTQHTARLECQDFIINSGPDLATARMSIKTNQNTQQHRFCSDHLRFWLWELLQIWLLNWKVHMHKPGNLKMPYKPSLKTSQQKKKHSSGTLFGQGQLTAADTLTLQHYNKHTTETPINTSLASLLSILERKPMNSWSKARLTGRFDPWTFFPSERACA